MRLAGRGECKPSEARECEAAEGGCDVGTVGIGCRFPGESRVGPDPGWELGASVGSRFGVRGRKTLRISLAAGGGGRKAGGQTLGYPASVGRTSSFILPAELSECQGKLQELHRLLQSLESLHRIPSAPVIPTHQVRSRGGRVQAPAGGGG